MENTKMIIKYASLLDFFETHTNNRARINDMRNTIEIPESFMVRKSNFYPEKKEIEFHLENQHSHEFNGRISKIELFSVEPYDDMNLLCNIKKRTIIQDEKSIEVEVIKAKKGE